MPRLIPSFLTLAVAILAAPDLGAQQVAPTPLPVFTAEANVARIDVRVTDRAGKPIEDLRPEDVRVIENGAPRPVLLVQRVGGAGRSYAEAAQRTVAAEISTNQGAPRGQLYILLFDQDHITAGAEQKVRLAAERFLKEKVRPEDRVAIFGVPAPGPSLPFTNNARAALDQLQHVRGGLERLTTGAAGDMTTYEAFEIMRGNDGVMQRFTLTSDNTSGVTRPSAIADSAKRQGLSLDEQRRLIRDNAQQLTSRLDGNARLFLSTAADVLRGFRSVDGRKTILLFSEGFYGDNVHAELRGLAAAAAEIYGVVYAFDLNTRVDMTGAEPLGNDVTSEITSRTATVGSVATDTGGQLVPDALTHLDDALTRVAAPSGDYYVIGFEPSPDALADRTGYRKVEITVARPGAVVETRSGYAAGADRRADNALPSLRRLAIDQALAAPFGHQGLRVEYTTYQSHQATGAERLVLSLEAELPVQASGMANAAADVVFVVRDARTGRVAASGSDQIALPVAPQRGRTTGVSPWRVQFLLPPGDYLMRCVVREPGGLVGSADRQFIVRSLSGPNVAPSDLVLGRPSPELPVRATAYTADPLPAAVRVYGRAAEQLANLSARLELRPVGGDAAVVGVAAVSGEVRDADGQVVRDLLFEVPLGSVPAGDYVARVEVKAAGEPLAELRRQVTVILGAAPPPPPPPPPPAASAAADSAIAAAVTAEAATSGNAAVRQAAAAVASLRAARYADAATGLRTAFGQLSTHAGIAFLLGWAERGNGAMVDAVSAFRNATVLDPTMVPAHLALADTYLQLQQPALAAQALEQGLSAVPGAVELRRLLESIKR